MLTKRQHELFSFIKANMRASDIGPSFEEMKDGIGTNSKGEVHRLLKQLEQRGFIKRLPYRARAIEIIRK